MQNQKLKIKSQTSSQLGFTIIELLIYMGILSILLVVLVEIFALILNIRFTSEATSSVEQDGNYIMARLTNDIRQAATIQQPLTTDAPSSVLHISSTNNTIDYTYDLDAHNNLELVNNVTSEHMQLNGTDTQVKSITFKTIGNADGVGVKDSVQITVVLQSKETRQNKPFQTTTFTTTVQEREIK